MVKKTITIGKLKNKLGIISNYNYSGKERVGKKVYTFIGLYSIKGAQYPYTYGENGLMLIVNKGDYSKIRKLITDYNKKKI